VLWYWQAKAKDHRIEELERQVREVNAKSHEYELECTSVSKELVTWKSRYDDLVDETQSLSAELTHAKPKLSAMEPQFEKLSREKSVWLSERDRLEEEVRKHKVYSDYVAELTAELESGDEYELETGQGSGVEGGLGLAKKHAIWCGLPSLRRLCPPLYNHIRSMFQDLHRTEVDLVQIQADCAHLSKVHAKAVEEQQHAEGRWATTEQQMANEISDLQGCMESLETQVHELKQKRDVVDQIRSILRSALEMSRDTEKIAVEGGGSFISNQSPVPKVSYSPDSRMSGGGMSGNSGVGGKYAFGAGGFDLEGALDQVQLEELAAISLPSTPVSNDRKTFVSSQRTFGNSVNQQRKANSIMITQVCETINRCMNV
jgi:predicted nuclease with TOPRIM domain